MEAQESQPALIFWNRSACPNMAWAIALC